MESSHWRCQKKPKSIEKPAGASSEESPYAWKSGVLLIRRAKGVDHLIDGSSIICSSKFNLARKVFVIKHLAFEFQMAFANLLRANFFRKIETLSSLGLLASARTCLKCDLFITSFLFLRMHARRELRIATNRSRAHEAISAA